MCTVSHDLPTTLMLIRAVSSPASFFNVILKGPESSLSAASMTRQLLSGYVSARILPLSVIPQESKEAEGKIIFSGLKNQNTQKSKSKCSPGHFIKKIKTLVRKNTLKAPNFSHLMIIKMKIITEGQINNIKIW